MYLKHFEKEKKTATKERLLSGWRLEPNTGIPRKPWLNLQLLRQLTPQIWNLTILRNNA